MDKVVVLAVGPRSAGAMFYRRDAEILFRLKPSVASREGGSLSDFRFPNSEFPFTFPLPLSASCCPHRVIMTRLSLPLTLRAC